MSLASHQLDAFFAVARLGSFTKAADELGVTQSALSQRILNLEEELETSLMIRDRLNLTLTEDGQVLMAYCRIREETERGFTEKIIKKRSPSLSGIIRIGGFSSVMDSMVLGALAPLIQKHPDIRLKVYKREMSELTQLLRRSEIEYAILDHQFDHDEIESQLLGYEENVLVEHKKLKDLDVYLDHDEEDRTTETYLRQFKMNSKKATVRRRFMDDINGLIEGARLGLGRCVLPKHLIVNETEFRVLHPEQVLKIPIYLHFHRLPYYSNLHKEVVSALNSI